MRTCGNCEYNDGCVYTSLPPRFKCTITGEFHFGNKPCSVDFVPVKHGRWKYISFLTVECSECKTQIHDLEYSNFCPNCGADMREREEE